MEREPRGDEHEQRVRLADAIERRAKDIIERWLDQVRADADAASVPLTELQDGIHDYLKRLADLLRGETSLNNGAASAWGDVAREHAITRVRLGFDVSQLFHELVILRKIITQDLRAQHDLDTEQSERLTDMIDAAVSSSLKGYVDFRDFTARRAEAEHIGFLTHELKNPLGAVVMGVEQLRRQELTPAQRRLCEILDRNLDRIRHLVDDVLLTERLQVGEVESRPIEVTIGQVLGDSLEAFKLAASEKNIRLEARLDPDLALRVDPALTLSAIENLLDNAIKYTDAGEVTLDVEEHDQIIEVHVRDHCGGLSPEELRVIFEPFKRAHTHKPGTGLGLAIARRAVETQGGTIHAESSAEAGCHFWFTLPRTQH